MAVLIGEGIVLALLWILDVVLVLLVIEDR